MTEYTPVNIEDVNVTTPPPYMDPGNSVAKKKLSRMHKESVAVAKPCEHCGALPQQIQDRPQQVVIWPAVRPANHIHQDSRQFIGFFMVIAIVIFLLFAACKYLP